MNEKISPKNDALWLYLLLFGVVVADVAVFLMLFEFAH